MYFTLQYVKYGSISELYCESAMNPREQRGLQIAATKENHPKGRYLAGPFPDLQQDLCCSAQQRTAVLLMPGS
jgi:hypothetical protein